MSSPPLLCLLVSLVAVHGASINNKLKGDPKVSCGPNEIRVVGASENPFEGVVYIKNWRRSEGCYHLFSTDSSSEPFHGVSLKHLGDCGMRITRNAEKQELEVTGVFIFGFHPLFVTVADKAFSVHCIFKQQDLTLTKGFDIKELITKGVIGRTAATPDVTFSIVLGGIPDPKATPAKAVRVGEPLVLIWELPFESEMYGVNVKDCAAETLRGRRAKVMEDGCSLDGVAIGDVAYTSDRRRAFATAMAFKFADEEDMWIKCSVSVCRKPSSETEREETCPPVEQNCAKRGKRDVRDNYQRGLNVAFEDQVLEGRIMVVDAYNQNSTTKLPSKKKGRQITPHSTVKLQQEAKWKLCMRKPIFALLSSFALLLCALTLALSALAIVAYLSSREKEKGEN